MTAAAVTGCGQSHDQGTASGSPVDVVGMVSGQVGMFGGPLNPKTGRMAADDSPAQGMFVTVSFAGHRVMTTQTGDDGRFTFTLAPGRYSLTPTCGQPDSVLVTAGYQTVVSLRCDVP